MHSADLGPEIHRRRNPALQRQAVSERARRHYPSTLHGIGWAKAEQPIRRQQRACLREARSNEIEKQPIKVSIISFAFASKRATKGCGWITEQMRLRQGDQIR